MGRNRKRACSLVGLVRATTRFMCPFPAGVPFVRSQTFPVFVHLHQNPSRLELPPCHLP